MELENRTPVQKSLMDFLRGLPPEVLQQLVVMSQEGKLDHVVQEAIKRAAARCAAADLVSGIVLTEMRPALTAFTRVARGITGGKCYTMSVRSGGTNVTRTRSNKRLLPACS